MPQVKPIPEGLHTLTPHLIVKGAARAIEFYKRAFGAEEVVPASTTPDGKVMHAHLRIGDSQFFMADEFPGGNARSPQSLGGTPVVFHIYVEDVDALWSRAVAAGVKVTMPLGDQFWGDRYGQVEDPFGHHWALATRKEQVSREEMNRRAQEAMAKMAQQHS